MASAVFPEWTGEDPAALGAWNTVTLGGVTLPGVCIIDGLECAIEVDTKKGKGHDKPTSTDNGVKPAKFEIDQWINTSMWPATQDAISQINPRRVGRERAPVQIIHPIVNVLGITNVRIVGVAPKHPTARGGMHIRWRVEEWFDKPIAVKKTNKVKEAKDRAAQNAANLNEMMFDALDRNKEEARQSILDDGIDPNTGIPLDPANGTNIGNSLVLGNPNVPTPSVGRALHPLGT